MAVGYNIWLFKYYYSVNENSVLTLGFTHNRIVSHYLSKSHNLLDSHYLSETHNPLDSDYLSETHNLLGSHYLPSPNISQKPTIC